MSWLFSQALVAEYSEATCSAGVPSAQLNVMPTQHPFWRNDKMMDASNLSRFGLTCAVLTDDLGVALLTWFLADSRVRTYPLPGLVPELTVSGQDCGDKWRESSVRFDPVTSSWKTAHCLWEEDLPWSSVTLPKWGSMRNGHVFQHPTLTRPINATASGLWPTPTVHGNNNSPKLGTSRGTGLATAVKTWPTPTASAYKGWSKNHNRANTDDRIDYTVEREAYLAGQSGQLNPTWEEWLMGWPIGWTELKPLAMDKFHEWQRQHSPCSQKSNREAA